jgi:hypothetical protein
MPAGWPACARAGCGGSGVYGAGADTCLAHLAEDELAAAVERCRLEPLDARGVTLRPALLSRVLTEERVLAQGARFDDAVFQGLAGFGRTVFAAPVTFKGARFEGDATFDKARFERCAGFEGAVFERIAAYREATFGGPAQFRGARFGGYGLFETTTFDRDAVFELASFDGVANFERAAFAAAAGFESATFAGYAGFGRARFGHRAAFDGATFNSVAWFGETRFEGHAVFAGAAFNRDAGFGEVVFDLGADFERATFAGDAAFSAARFKRGGRFVRATFERAAAFDRAAFDEEVVLTAATFEGGAILGPMHVGGTVVLDFGVYRAAATVDVSAARISCLGTRFLEGVNLRASGAEVALDDARFEGRSIVAARRPTAGDRTTNPRLVSLRRADVADLVLADLDLSPCLFAGACGLDRLHIDALPRLAPAPTGWRRRGRIPWRWTPRLTIAEEHRWRARQGERGEGWNPAQCRSAWLSESESLPDQQDIGPGEVAAIYRALRDGREHRGERGPADDFHYGEMEMRRNDPGRPRAERIVLSLYWLTSGYGLRRRRALGALLAASALGRLCSIFRERRDARA